MWNEVLRKEFLHQLKVKLKVTNVLNSKWSRFLLLVKPFAVKQSWSTFSFNLKVNQTTIKLNTFPGPYFSTFKICVYYASRPYLNSFVFFLVENPHDLLPQWFILLLILDRLHSCLVHKIKVLCDIHAILITANYWFFVLIRFITEV